MTIAVNDIIQINPAHAWGGCLAIVSEVKSFGCQAYVEIPLQGAAYIHLNKADYAKVGKAAYARGER